MSRYRLNEHYAEAAVLGGAVLGGGGGGSIRDGMERAILAVRIGSPILIPLDELNEEDLILTASAVGAPAAPEKFVRPIDHVRAVALLLEKRPLKLSGLIANENGAGSGVNGWLQASMLGIPMVDAPANGRAHPTGLMGAMGLHRLKGYTSLQTAVGGNPETGRYLELVIESDLRLAANLVRSASVQAGGTVAVARDPVKASYIRDHAAPGGTSQAIRVGEAILHTRDQGAQAVIQAITGILGGRILVQGEVTEIGLETIGGYDVGRLTVQGDHRGDLTFWNEFMTMEMDGQRRASFPDLITLLSLENGIPVSSAEVKKGQRVGVLVVSKANLILGEGVRLPETLQEAEKAIGKTLLIE